MIPRCTTFFFIILIIVISLIYYSGIFSSQQQHQQMSSSLSSLSILSSFSSSSENETATPKSDDSENTVVGDDDETCSWREIVDDDDDDDDMSNDNNIEKNFNSSSSSTFEWPKKWNARYCHRYSYMPCKVLRERAFGVIPEHKFLDSYSPMKMRDKCCVFAMSGEWDKEIDIKEFRRKYSGNNNNGLQKNNNNNDDEQDHFVKYSFPSDFDSSTTHENNNAYNNLTATREAFLQAIGKLPRIRANVTYLSPLPGQQQKNVRKRMKYEKLQQEQSFVSIFIPGNSYTRAIIISIAAAMRGMHRHFDRGTHTCFRYTVTNFHDYLRVQSHGFEKLQQAASVALPINELVLQNSSEKVIFDVIWEYTKSFENLDFAALSNPKKELLMEKKLGRLDLPKIPSLDSYFSSSASASSLYHKNLNLNMTQMKMKMRGKRTRSGFCGFSAILMRPMFSWRPEYVFKKYSKELLINKYLELYSRLFHCLVPSSSFLFKSSSNTKTTTARTRKSRRTKVGVFSLMLTPSQQYRGKPQNLYHEWENIAVESLLKFLTQQKQKQRQEKHKILILPPSRNFHSCDRINHTQCVVRQPPPSSSCCMFTHPIPKLQTCADVASREFVYHFGISV